MKRLAAVLFVLLSIVPTNVHAAEKLKTAKGEIVLWFPDEHDGHKRVCIFQNKEGVGVTVYANPKYTYQDAITTGPSENGAVGVEIRYIEVVPAFPAGEGPAVHKGWRMPQRVHRYFTPVWGYTIRERDSGRIKAWLDVFSDGYRGYLIVMVTLRDRLDKAEFKPGEMK